MPILTESWQEEEILRCAHGYDGTSGLIYWFREYVYTYDEPHKTICRYPLWPFQVDYLNELEKGGRILVEKSRDMMITWTTALFMLWHMLFDPNWTGFAISRRENEVDDGGEEATTRSIMGRIKFTWDHLPDWMKGDVSFSLLKIRNLEHGMNTAITGEATKITSGQSVAVTFKWGDEFSQVDQSEKVHGSMSGGNWQTLVYTGIANGPDNAFARLRNDPTSGFRILSYPWNCRPDRDDAWYRWKVADLDPFQRASQIDIEYEVMTANPIYGEFSVERNVRRLSDLPVVYDRYFLTFDPGFARPAAMYLAGLRAGRLYILRELYQPGIHVKLPPAQKEGGVEDWVDRAWKLERLVDPDVTQERHRIECVCVGWGSTSTHDSSDTAAHFAMDGFRTFVVSKDRLTRIRLCSAWMRSTGAEESYLTISEDCANLRRELPRYHYAVVSGIVQERPADGNDHGIEALESLCEYLQAPERPSSRWVSNVDQILVKGGNRGGPGS